MLKFARGDDSYYNAVKFLLKFARGDDRYYNAVIFLLKFARGDDRYYNAVNFLYYIRIKYQVLTPDYLRWAHDPNKPSMANLYFSDYNLHYSQ